MESRGRGRSGVQGGLGHHRNGWSAGRDSDIGNRREVPGVRDTGDLLFHAWRTVRTVLATEPGGGVAIVTIRPSRWRSRSVRDVRTPTYCSICSVVFF
jgi:hypothetical protein